MYNEVLFPVFCYENIYVLLVNKKPDGSCPGLITILLYGLNDPHFKHAQPAWNYAFIQIGADFWNCYFR